MSPCSMRKSSAPSPSTRASTGTWIATLRRSVMRAHPQFVGGCEKHRRLAVDRLKTPHDGLGRQSQMAELHGQRFGVGIFCRVFVFFFVVAVVGFLCFV